MGLVKVAATTDDQFKPPTIPNNGTNKSIFMDVTGERLSINGAPAISCKHFRNNFTFAIWFTRENNVNAPFITLTTAASTKFQITTQSSTVSNVILRGLGVGIEKQYNLGSVMASSTSWRHLACVVNRGATEELLIYLNGVLLSPTKTTDDPLTDRSALTIDAFLDIGAGGGDQRHYSISIWNKSLKANEIPVIYNGGKANLNLLKNKGKYKSGKKLQHWWIYEVDPTRMGRDYGRARKSEDINLMRNALNITAADDLLLGAPI